MLKAEVRFATPLRPYKSNYARNTACLHNPEHTGTDTGTGIQTNCQRWTHTRPMRRAANDAEKALYDLITRKDAWCISIRIIQSLISLILISSSSLNFLVLCHYNYL